VFGSAFSRLLENLKHRFAVVKVRSTFGSMLPRRYRPPNTPSFALSDHCDGRYFFNPNLKMTHSAWDLLKWKWTSKPAPWPKVAGGLVEPTFASRPSAQDLTATLVGHATFLLQFAGVNILTDPVWSDRCSPVSWAGPKRVRPPAILWEALPEIQLVLLSHNHYDHCDLLTLQRLQERFQPLILTGLGNRRFLEFHGLQRVAELDWWQQISLNEHFPGANLTVTFTPALHWSNRGGNTRNTSLWGGFQLQHQARSILFAGDSGYAEHFKEIHTRLGAPDLALLPIGAYEPRWFMRSMHMNPAEAVQAHLDLNAKRSLAMHHGTWQLTDEGIAAPTQALGSAMEQHGISPERFRAPAFGHTVTL
jgi:L-ascorbate metabolism protein UlaG (beta-lactamase superfamily)